eukprot:GAHX01000374.1.p1 GENE.GAHX01000374.1~~GAHX01000374.1.p1  ORF type:complete len:146 (+),score=33.88 GAHX01000374.1:38-475(+)
MGKGGLSYLNKKKWHPGSIRNMKEVYNKENSLLTCVKKSVYAAKTKNVEDVPKECPDKRMGWMIPDAVEKQNKHDEVLTDFDQYKTKKIKQKYDKDTEKSKQDELKEKMRKTKFVQNKLKENRNIRSKIDKIQKDPLYHILKRNK